VSMHLDLDQLAELDEGLLGPEGATRASEHLATCPECRQQQLRLESARAELAAAPPVGPVPDDVADRLDAALSAAAHPVASSAHPGSGTVVPVTARRSPVGGMRWLQAAAVLVLLLAVVGIGVSAVGGGDSAGGGSGGGSTAADSSAAGNLAGTAQVPVQQTGTHYTASDLGRQVQHLVSTKRAAVPGPEAAGAPAARSLSGARLTSCLRGLQDTHPLAVDLASFDGQPAAVVVLRTPGDPKHVDAWVVAPSCSASNAQVKDFLRVPRP
jgi:hypothetical protein